MRELAFERKRELYSAGRYFIPPFKLPPGFRFASEEAAIEYIDKNGQWYALPGPPVNNCTHPEAEPQLVCETCGHREALPDKSEDAIGILRQAQRFLAEAELYPLDRVEEVCEIVERLVASFRNKPKSPWRNFRDERPGDRQRCRICYEPQGAGQIIIVVTYNAQWDDFENKEIYINAHASYIKYLLWMPEPAPPTAAEIEAAMKGAE